MPTRKQAFDIIRYEYSTHGEETRESMRAYVENRISFESRLEAVKEGLRIYEKRGKKMIEKYLVCPGCHSPMYPIGGRYYKCSYCSMTKRGE